MKHKYPIGNTSNNNNTDISSPPSVMESYVEINEENMNINMDTHLSIPTILPSEPRNERRISTTAAASARPPKQRASRSAARRASPNPGTTSSPAARPLAARPPAAASPAVRSPAASPAARSPAASPARPPQSAARAGGAQPAMWCVRCGEE